MAFNLQTICEQDLVGINTRKSALCLLKLIHTPLELKSRISQEFNCAQNFGNAASFGGC